MVAAIFYEGKVSGTPANSGFKATTIATGTFGEIDVFNQSSKNDLPAGFPGDVWLSLQKTKGPSDLYVQSNVWPAVNPTTGAVASTGWHTHPGHSLIIVTAGTITEYEADCTPHEQWVYPDEIGPGMVMPADYLHRTGYRLPTEAEWEFAARAGTSTAHFFGNGVALLDRYAWFMANSENHGWPVGTTKPNQFGLFDMYGNAWEWVQDRYLEYSTDSTATWVDNEDASLVVTDNAKRIRRGGSWSYDKETMRSAHRGASQGYQLNNRMDSVGFRVARTLPTASRP